MRPPTTCLVDGDGGGDDDDGGAVNDLNAMFSAPLPLLPQFFAFFAWRSLPLVAALGLEAHGQPLGL